MSLVQVDRAELARLQAIADRARETMGEPTPETVWDAPTAAARWAAAVYIYTGRVPNWAL